MDLTSLIIFIILLLFITHIPNYVSSSSNCPVSRCGDSRLPEIRFPFRLVDSEQPITCGYPDFDVSCDHASKQTLLNLQGLGNLYIKNIDYGAQEIWVNDPNKCLPQKLLNFNLSNTPFSGIYHRNFDFFNCTSMIKTHTYNLINCLSGLNHFVYASPSNGSVSPPETCVVIASMVVVPIQWPATLRDNVTFTTSSELNEDLRLSWFMPECQSCELNGQMCGLETNSSGSRVIVCSNIPISNGTKVESFPITTFIAVGLIICSPTIIFLLAYLYIWVRARYEDRSVSGPVVTQRPAHLGELGLEDFNAEFARQFILLGLRSSELQPNIISSEIEETGRSSPTMECEKNACAICMVEYQVKDKIGNLPTCGHYFHGDCINKWLLQWPGIVTRACPICRARIE